MGKKHRNKQNERTVDSYKLSQEKKKILQDAADLFATCIKTVNPHQEWDYYLKLFEFVEEFKEKQNTVFNLPAVPKHGERQIFISPFLEWLKVNDASWDGIELVDCSLLMGFGIKATKNIKCEELLVSIPRSVMITHEYIIKESYLKDLIEKNELLLQMPNICLALFLHCEKYNPASKFKPYIDILPQNFNTTLYFTPDELKLLRGTSAFSQAINHYKSIVRQFTLIYKLFNGKESNKPYVQKINETARNSFTFDAYRWCVSAVSTRQNEIPCKEASSSKTLALIPLWDMFNHENGPMSTDFDVKEDKLHSFAMRDFTEGSQVKICYGKRNRADLLIYNGFVCDDYYFDGEHVSISLGISPKDPLYHKKKLVLERMNCPATGDFIVTTANGGVPATPPLFNFLRVFHMNSEELDQWLTMDDTELQMHSISKVMGHEQFLIMLKYLEDRLNLLVMVRERSVGKKLDDLCLDDSLSPRSKLAIVFQRIEKTTLDTCIQQCKASRSSMALQFSKKFRPWIKRNFVNIN